MLFIGKPMGRSIVISISRGFSKSPQPLPLLFALAEAANATEFTLGAVDAATTAMTGAKSVLGVK